jgi:hypothetical protein
MTPRPELREAVREVLEEHTTAHGTYNVVKMADELATLREEVQGWERRWAQLLTMPTLKAAAQAHYETASLFRWERLSPAEQALAKASMLAALVAARKTALSSGRAPEVDDAA